MCNKKGNFVNFNFIFDVFENGVSIVINIFVYILGEGKFGKSC